MDKDKVTELATRCADVMCDHPYYQSMSTYQNIIDAYISGFERCSSMDNQGVRWSINKLRELSLSDLSRWSHSRSVNFAPVELSDYLLIEMRNRKDN